MTSTTDQTAALARAVESIAAIVGRQADRGALDVHDRAVLERALGILHDGAPTLELIVSSYLAAGPGARLVVREREYGGHEALIVTDKGSVRSTTSISSPATAEALQPLAGRHGGIMSEGAAYKHDLWVACLHEAAHVVIARELGYLTAHMRIYRNPNPGRWQKHITGQSYWHERMSSDDRCMVALAGQVAEYLDDLSDWTVASGRDLDDLLQDGELTLSDTDAEAAGRYVEADLGRCIDLVRAHWDRIQSKAREAFEMGPREPPERR